MEKITNTKQLGVLQEKLIQNHSKIKRSITVCCGTACIANNSLKLVELLTEELKKSKNTDIEINVKPTGCPGFCEQGPIVTIMPENWLYTRVTPDDAKEIIERTIQKNEIIERLVYKDPKEKKLIPYEKDIPFYKKQLRTLLQAQAEIDPTMIEDYIRIGGYQALSKALFKTSQEEIIETISKSGLRGRGGAGYPTGKKWLEVKNQPVKPKYVICNADEGDPGAFMDRALLEGNPHSIIEGMIIGGFSMDSNYGYVYVRDEYPLAVKNLEIALAQARDYGFLGKNILGSNFDFDIISYKGAGAFVCGESSALIASIMGMPGEPRQKIPRNAVKGLWGCPTNINNVETWANVPHIINKGDVWFSSMGSPNSKGTKIFSLVGKIINTGLVEVPMGITLREVIFDIGGGIPHGKKFKAVQTGGPSGGCLPESKLDLPVDFESLNEAGSIMGSGGMIVMDEDTCMVNIAKYFTDFNRDESCGKCTSCREGLYRMSEILEKITKGNGKVEDLDLMQELSDYIIDTSLCGLGTTAPNPALSTLRYFKDEYIEHIINKRCPAKVCKELIAYSIDKNKCTGCQLCAKACPVSAITGEFKKIHIIDEKICIKCGRCYTECPPKVNAVLIVDSCKKAGENNE